MSDAIKQIKKITTIVFKTSFLLISLYKISFWSIDHQLPAPRELTHSPICPGAPAAVHHRAGALHGTGAGDQVQGGVGAGLQNGYGEAVPDRHR